MTTAPTRSGSWRPDTGFEGEHLRVVMKHERGVTPKGYLRVPFRFQCPPLDRYGRRWESDFPTYDSLTEGERPQQGSNRLRRPALSTMMIDEDYPWLVWRGSLDVQRLIAELRAIERQHVPFRLVVSQPALWGPKPLTNLVVVMTSLNVEQRGGEVGAEYLDAEFMEWPRQQLDRRSARRPSDSDKERRHKLEHGDTLYKIAGHYYKKRSSWTLIRLANGITGVSPDDAGELAKWAKRHSRKTLKIPPIGTAKGGTGTTDPLHPNVSVGEADINR